MTPPPADRRHRFFTRVPRSRLGLALGLVGAGAWLVLAAPAATDVAPVGPEEVLVLYNETWPDEDGNRRSDSRDVAEYYAARRGIPARNLLGLALTDTEAKPTSLAYAELFRRVLGPVQRRIAEIVTAGGQIHYLVTCYGVPLGVETGLDARSGEHPLWKPPEEVHDASPRALGQWLVSLDENLRAGVNRVTGKPGPRGGADAPAGSPPLGAARADLALPTLLGQFQRPDQPASFRTWRAGLAERGVYLVTHLGGDSAEVAKGLVDKALYAERYLQSYAGQPGHAYYGRAYLDHQPGGGAGHRPSLVRAALWLQGLLPGSVYAAANRAQPWFGGQPWEVRIDNADPEIGSRPSGAAAPHRAISAATIERVDAARRVVTLGPGEEPGPAVYFGLGATVESSGGGRAVVLAPDSERGLRLSQVARFRAGDTLTWRQERPFPLADVVFYYGYYSLSTYFDVYQFRVGAVGSHMDSGSIVWARAALRRGITATSGAITEPSSGGLPQMGPALVALTSGHDLAEAFYAATPFHTRWNTVFFGDPLYAPFRRPAKLPDVTPPVIERLDLQPLRAPGGGRLLRVSAELGGTAPEQRDDVALWQIEHGPTDAYGQVVPYVEWPDPERTDFDERRRYWYTRRFVHEIGGLPSGTPYHVRVTARDPFGNTATHRGQAVRSLPSPGGSVGKDGL